MFGQEFKTYRRALMIVAGLSLAGHLFSCGTVTSCRGNNPHAMPFYIASWPAQIKIEATEEWRNAEPTENCCRRPY